MFWENLNQFVGEVLENSTEGIETIAQTPAVHHAAHEVVQKGIEKVVEIMDLDEDGSIFDTVPDLISSGLEGLSSLFND